MLLLLQFGNDPKIFLFLVFFILRLFCLCHPKYDRFSFFSFSGFNSLHNYALTSARLVLAFVGQRASKPDTWVAFQLSIYPLPKKAQYGPLKDTAHSPKSNTTLGHWNPFPTSKKRRGIWIHLVRELGSIKTCPTCSNARSWSDLQVNISCANWSGW